MNVMYTSKVFLVTVESTEMGRNIHKQKRKFRFCALCTKNVAKMNT